VKYSAVLWRRTSRTLSHTENLSVRDSKMASREDWPNDRYLVFQISETHRRTDAGRDWVAKSVKYESYRFSFESEIKEIREHMFNKYYANINDSYDVNYHVVELNEDMINSVSNSATWGEE
tara:strand:+ start:609 stop:971 length:363 start_codon:yes stop_codon:yes gene_type:complete